MVERIEQGHRRACGCVGGARRDAVCSPGAVRKYGLGLGEDEPLRWHLEGRPRLGARPPVATTTVLSVPKAPRRSDAPGNVSRKSLVKHGELGLGSHLGGYSGRSVGVVIDDRVC